jgi:hypothetical protein
MARISRRCFCEAIDALSSCDGVTRSDTNAAIMERESCTYRHLLFSVIEFGSTTVGIVNVVASLLFNLVESLADVLELALVDGVFERPPSTILHL